MSDMRHITPRRKLIFLTLQSSSTLTRSTYHEKIVSENWLTECRSKSENNRWSDELEIDCKESNSRFPIIS